MPRKRRSYFDDSVKGQRRRLLAQASRNGIFFVLDRMTGKNLIAKPFIACANWFLGFRPDGSLIPNPLKEAQVGGALVSPNNGGAANWAPPTFDPDTGLFYVNSVEGYEVVYRTAKPGEKVSASGGASEHGAASARAFARSTIKPAGSDGATITMAVKRRARVRKRKGFADDRRPPSVWRRNFGPQSCL
jgi:hypothetical protein